MQLEKAGTRFLLAAVPGTSWTSKVLNYLILDWEDPSRQDSQLLVVRKKIHGFIFFFRRRFSKNLNNNVKNLYVFSSFWLLWSSSISENRNREFKFARGVVFGVG